MSKDLEIIEGILENIAACADSKEVAEFVNNHLPQEQLLICLEDGLWVLDGTYLIQEDILNLIEESLHQLDYEHQSRIYFAFLEEVIAL